MRTGPFVGRLGEMTALTALLSERGGVALVTGEPGIGKSRVLAEFGAPAGERGWQVLHAQALAAEGAPPFWVWRQALRAWAATADPDQRDRARSAEVGAIIPELADGPAAGGSEGRFMAFEAVRELLATVAGAGVVVLLDDLHRADDGALSLLAHLVERPPQGRLLIVAAARPGELAARPLGPQLRADIARHGAHVELGGLSTGEVGAQLTALLGARPGGDLVTAVRERTGGNPLFVQELSRLVAAGRRPDGELPAVVRDAIRHHLDALPSGCRDLLTTAAVVGPDIDAVELAALTAVPLAQVLAHLEHAQRAEVLLGAPFRFRHDLFRETLQVDRSLPERSAVHLRVAEHRERAPEPSAREIARHRLAALPLGDPEQAAAWTRAAAAEAVTALSFEDAATLYDRAVEITDPPDGDLLVAAGRAHLLAGDQAGAVERCTAAAELAERAGDPVRLGHAALALPEVPATEWTGLVGGWCERALADLPEHNSALRAGLLAQHCLAGFGTEREDGIGVASATALAMAERVGDDGALRLALRARQVACAAPTGQAERVELGARMVALGRRGGDLDAQVWGHLWRFDAHVQAGATEAAIAELSALEPVVARLRSPTARWQLVRSSAVLKIAGGQFATARALAAEARALAPRSELGAGHWLPQALVLARLTGTDIDPEPLFPAANNATIRAFRFVNLAPWHLALGDRAAAADLYEQLPGWETPLPNLGLLLHAVRGEVAAALGDVDGARAAHTALLHHPDLHATTGAGLHVTLGSARRFLGVTAAAIGSADAVSHLEAAVVANERSGYPPFAAQARFDLATVLAGAGDRDAALAAAEQAARTANRLGMAPLGSATKRLLDELRANTRALTPRQREVAELVARGRTNREIAAELHIAQRTAENHVKDIMTALDLRNRSQIAVWATHNEAGTTSNPIR